MTSSVQLSPARERFASRVELDQADRQRKAALSGLLSAHRRFQRRELQLHLDCALAVADDLGAMLRALEHIIAARRAALTRANRRLALAKARRAAALTREG
jgi:hypothetical protein